MVRLKEYAKRSDKSLSEIIERYLDKVNMYKTHTSTNSKLDEMIGIIEMNDSRSYREILEEILIEKYESIPE